MSPATKCLLFPLSAPRWQSQIWLPLRVLCAAVDGYATAQRASLHPEGSPLLRAGLNQDMKNED